METFLFYLLRVSIAATIFYFFFRFILSNRTFHAINRMVVLSIVVMTLILPLFTVQLPEMNFLKPKVETTATQPTIENVLASLKNAGSANAATVASNPVKKIPWIKMIGLIYLAGMVVALLQFIISFVRMSRIISATRKERMPDNSLLCISDKKVSPFSWMKYIVLSTADFEADSHDIILHEQAHVAFRHSFDLLFLDVYSLVFWFNPFAWLLRLELQTIHEYQADEKVLSEGANTRNYQLSLIRQCVGEYKFSLANNLEYNNLHKRIKMTMKAKSTSKQKWLYATIGLSVMLCLVVLSFDGLKVKAAAINLNKTIATKISGTTTSQASDSSLVIKRAVKVPPPTIIEEVQPAKLVENKPDTEQESESIRAIGSEAQAEPKPVVFIDGKESSQSLDAINTSDIERFELIKAASAIKIYGDKGKNGVIFISTKKKDISSSTNDNAIRIGSKSDAEFYKDMIEMKNKQ